MKVSIFNLGCKLNFAEISQVQKQFENAGYDIVNFNDKADIVLINTCTVTHNADADSRKYIRRAIKNNPNAFIGVMGCYSQLKPDEVIAIEGVDAVLGTNNKFNITELIENFEKKEKPEVFIPDLEDVPFHFASSVDNESRTRTVLKIQDGCDYVCTYCTIPFARGKSRAMDFQKFKDKLIEISSSDFHEIVLTGINLGEYKAPTGENFTDVIKHITESGLNFRARISSIEPNLVKDEIIDLVKNSEKMCNHFHIPLQSGSPEILKLMKRRYKSSTFEDLVWKIKSEIPDCCIGADVIVGFPGESDIHFKETYNLLNSLPISYLHVFTYSDRDAAPSSTYTNQVNPHLRKERTILLRELSEKKRTVFINSQIGKTFTVIPETTKPKDDKIIIKGMTDNYIQTRIETDRIITKPITVRLTEPVNDYARAIII
jgi:threonylcarbamoyladenosine tRNA methylthiotransferase MtaB